MFGLAKLLRDARFELRVENVPGTRVYWVDRGRVESHVDKRDPQRFEQVGDPPRCRPGDRVELRFRLLSELDDDARPLLVKVNETHPVTASFEQRMVPGDEAVVSVTLSSKPPHPIDDPVRVSLWGHHDDRQVHGGLKLLCDVGPEERTAAHVVVATESRFAATARRNIYLKRQHHAAALEDIRRYAARHAGEPGGAFLAEVARQPDLESAFRAASLEPTVDDAGHLRGLAFVGDRLPGAEQHLLGMLRSYAGLTGAVAEQLSFAYAHAPEHWTTFVFTTGNVKRQRELRDPRRP